MRYALSLVFFVTAFCGQFAMAQTPRTLYTWAGTGDTAQWISSGPNLTPLTNTTPGFLTATEMGDELDPGIVGGAVVIRDQDNRRFDSSTEQGGLDLTGLGFIEIDVQHNHPTATIPVQFFIQATPAYNYLWFGPGPTFTPSGPDWQLGPGPHTMQFPVSLLTPAQQAYIRVFGLSVRDHVAAGNLTWTISEARSVGTPLTQRNIATHDVGSPDNGLNGVYANFDRGADPSSPSVVTIIGSDGGQNQTGFTQNTSGTGSLQWTDRGGAGTAIDPSGAAIAYGNGTIFDGNSFNERLTDLSNYNRVLVRMSATDTVNPDGTIGFAPYFQRTGYAYAQATGQNLTTDGAFHDITFDISAITDRENVNAWGLNLFAHPNNAVINIDLVRFLTVAGVDGDYNNNGVVDAADYVLWRDGGPLQNDPTPGVQPADYNLWKANFGKTPGSGSSLAAVPEPATAILMFSVVVGGLLMRRRGV